MSAYLGMLGRLAPIYSNPSMGVSREDGYTFETTLEGRVKAQARPVTRRSWALSAKAASPTDAGTLGGFASGEWGPGPFIWVAPDAPSTNLLPPDVASSGPTAVTSAGVQVAGPMNLGTDGWAGRSLMTSTPAARTNIGSDQTPVLPGAQATGSVWAIGAGARLRVQWYTAGGVAISAADSTNVGVSGTPTRLVVTATPPTTAASCLLSLTGATQWARPAITWTSAVFPWAEGQGCPKAVVSTVGRTALSASSSDPGSNYSDMSFTITEVG